ncbi:unnamed protein product [Menidia menidia]|uniref:(Atlantic silverside) hypothetical protein n=1 Tax=Menidia menidia TaxID=238744 RepID=A0A8S4BCJ7_9TELE|nr:unnamed protein product [Menidia menidia]
MRRLKRGARPVTNFLRNLSALSNWHSVYTSAIAFIVKNPEEAEAEEEDEDGDREPDYRDVVIRTDSKVKELYDVEERLGTLEDSPPQPPRKQQSPSNNGTGWRTPHHSPPESSSPPPTTAQIYMNAAWHGWAIPMFLFLAILRLSLNYLIARGWRIQWSIVPEVSEPMEPPKEDLTVSEKFQLVLDVAQKAQNLFGKMADVLEKIKNLFMWVQPESTRKLYICLWMAFITSCVFPYKLMGFMMGVYAGIKFFIIDFLFKSCPKLRDKYDTPFIVWNSLPTDPQLKERTNATVSRRPEKTGRPLLIPTLRLRPSPGLHLRAVKGTTERAQREVWSSRLQKWLYERFGVYIEDFRFQPEENTPEGRSAAIGCQLKVDGVLEKVKANT